MPLRTHTTHTTVNSHSEGTLSVGNAKQISIQTICSGIGTAGSAQIYVHVSNDAVNWVRFYGIIPVTSSWYVTDEVISAYDFERTGIIQIAGDGSSLYILDPVGCYQHLRVALATTEAEGGSFSITLGIQEEQRS